ncbi:hypothetical protein F2Q68_00008247 [Brassica cretica]|uniref:rRNA 2'-O-methyltransferase fibrillarin n=1 Tax=Brassica cretica TaxID=69181 RepID=A0A8S9KYJ1_BRACR|nr:hypothetical protein F2Q68_00008247 [Brassica cretica]
MLLVQAHWNCIALRHGQIPCPHIPQMHEVLGFWTSTDFWLGERDVTLTLIYRSRETKKVISPLPATATSPPLVIATDADAVYDSSHHFKRPGRKLQRTVSAFTFVRCANSHAVEALRCPSLCCCVEMAIADDTAEGLFVWFDGVTMKLHNLRARLVEEGVNPEDTGLPPFIADMEGKTYTFQVRVTAYNFTEHHKTFTITHIVDEIDRVPLLDVADDWDDGDDDDKPADKPAVKPLPVEVQSGGISGNAHKKTVDSTSNVFKKTRVARYGLPWLSLYSKDEISPKRGEGSAMRGGGRGPRGRGPGGRVPGGRGPRSEPGGMKGGNKVIVTPHRHEGVFTGKGKDEVILTKNLVPGESVYNEKRISVQNEDGIKVEYRVWNPFCSKLAAAIFGGLDDIWIKPGAKVLYLGAASGTSVSHVSDIVGHNEDGIKVEYRVWNPFCSKLAAAIFGGLDDIWIKPGAKVLYLGAASGTSVSHVSDIVGPANCIDATMPAETVFSNEVKKLQADELKPAEQITLEPYERDHACVVGGYRVPRKQKTATAS